MSAKLLLQAGDPEAALQALKQEVKADPINVKLRIFLFQLLAVTGQWKRAQTQLELAGEMDIEAAPMMQAYRDVINCELHRDAVFQGKSKPLIFGEPEQWVAQLVEAQQAFANGDMETFAKLNAQALESADARSGKINDETFEWIADADQRIGPVFECMFNGQYYWVPISRVKSLFTEEPTDLRDLVWMPAEITWVNEAKIMVMMPSRYPRLEGVLGTGLLSRRTDWEAHTDEIFEGTGQRVFATDQKDYSLLQVRSIVFDE